MATPEPGVVAFAVGEVPAQPTSTIIEGGPPRRPARNPSLDAIRGLAVLAVVAFHLDLVGARGGWVGVDVFFVLSGYLITSLLLDERARSGGVSLGAFWGRRARRLLPALLAVLAAVAVAGALLGGAERFPTLRWDGIAALGYVANWRFIASDQSYFSSFSVSPLRHMWSLAIEEQFYVLWPLVFVALARWVRDRRIQVAVLVAVASASAWWTRTLVLHGVDLSRAYYGSDTRLPTILAGCIAALATRERPFATLGSRAAATGAALGGAAMLVVVVVAVPESQRWLYADGGLVLVALAAACVVVGAARLGRGPLARLGHNRVLVRAGLISYSLYLWHWPVIVFLDHDRTHWPTPVLRLAQLALALALAEASYRFVEQPIRSRRVRLPRPVPTAFAAVAVVAALFAALLQPPPGQAPPTSGHGVRTAGRVGIVGTPQVLVLGDSEAWVLSGNVPPAFPYGVRGVFQAACDIIGDRIYLGGTVQQAADDCPQWSRRWHAAARHHPDAVVVTIGLRQLFDPQVDGRRLAVGSPAWAAAYRAAVERALHAIRLGTHAPIFWLNVPCYRWALGGTAGEEHDPDRLAAVNGVLRATLASHPSVHLVDYRDRVCDGPRATEVESDLRPDGAHLSRAAAADLWTFLLPRIAAALRRPVP